MSTAIAPLHEPLARPIFQRFLWKEYRMLREFWLAVGALAVVVQAVLPYFLYDSRQASQALFATAWGAAALYAVGAAITLFSAEREEQTHEFLVQLPGRWLPMFVGKLLLANLSAVALAVVLSLCGYFLAGSQWPATAAMLGTLAIAGVAILEATVWGLLFSLLMKQPLLAAILAMAAASFGAQLAVASTSRFSQAFLADAYVQAVPQRVLLCLGVLLVDVWLASKWLQPMTTGLASDVSLRIRRRRAIDTTIPALTFRAGPRVVSRRRMAARLLWQTWHESWPTMLAAVPLAMLLMLGLVATTWLAEAGEIAVLFCPLLLPALWGALVFRADQRSDHRQFLVAHAGRPRWVWLARQAVWLSTLLAICLAIQLAASWFLGTVMFRSFHEMMGYYSYDQFHLDSGWQNVWRVENTVATYWQITALSWCAFLATYGVGQLCSMLLRREVLAGFLALLLSVVLTAWTTVIGLWQLSPWWYVLPIALVTLWATWLRAPDWIVGRNRARTWIKPALALTLPLACLFAYLPTHRLQQLNVPLGERDLRYLQEPLQTSLAKMKASLPAARGTATEYEKLAAALDDLADNPEPKTEIIKKIETLSQQPECQLAPEALLPGNRQWNEVEKLKTLLLLDAQRLQGQGELDKAWQRHLTRTRLEGQVLQNQRSQLVEYNYLYSLRKQDNTAILEWAQHPDQTSEQLKSAIVELQAVFDQYPEPREAVLADHQWVREILNDQRPPSFLEAKTHQMVDYLPYLANRLPWERERALRALDLLTTQRLNYVDAVSFTVRGGEVLNWAPGMGKTPTPLGELLQRNFNGNNDTYRTEKLVDGDWRAFVRAQKQLAQCRTSYLVADELGHSGNRNIFLEYWVNSQVAQRGLLTQMALLAYRLDHGAYPETLAELALDYLPSSTLLDPYTRQPFEHRLEGLDLPLHLRQQRMITAGTPIFWSVGPHNSTLAQRDLSEEKSSDEPEVVSEPEWVYRFTNTNWPTNRVFALPKIADE